jgi:hypothetical protein
MYCLEKWRGEQRISPPGDNFTPIRGLIHPWGTNRPWGSKFDPRGEVKNGPLGSNSRREVLTKVSARRGAAVAQR